MSVPPKRRYQTLALAEAPFRALDAEVAVVFLTPISAALWLRVPTVFRALRAAGVLRATSSRVRRRARDGSTGVKVRCMVLARLGAASDPSSRGPRPAHHRLTEVAEGGGAACVRARLGQREREPLQNLPRLFQGRTIAQKLKEPPSYGGCV